MCMLNEKWDAWLPQCFRSRNVADATFNFPIVFSKNDIKKATL